MRGEHELQVGQAAGQGGDDRLLPFRMEVQIDFVDEHYAAAFNQLRAGGSAGTEVIQEVRDPADVRTIAVGERLERQIGAADTEEVLGIADELGFVVDHSGFLACGATRRLSSWIAWEYRAGSWKRKRGSQADNGTIVTASSKRPATRE